MIEKIKKTREYLNYLERHYYNVQRAYGHVVSKCGHMRFVTDKDMLERIKKAVEGHDDSKMSAEEFTQYREFFYPIDESEKDKSKFELAWQHHLDNSHHHWQNIPIGSRDKNNLSNSEIESIVKVVINWVAMGFEFKNSALEYYNQNKPKISLSTLQTEFIEEVLKEVCKFQ
jgi:hypothetical protein